MLSSILASPLPLSFLDASSCLPVHLFKNSFKYLRGWQPGYFILLMKFLSPRDLHLVFCCVLYVLALIWLVLMALFCDAIRRDSFSLLMFPFLSHVHVFSGGISLISHLKLSHSYFSSFFYFQVIVVPLVLVSLVLFMVTVISVPSRFSV